jgi:GNAT superfamily N-acetyltransferase
MGGGAGEAEPVERYGHLDENERGLTAAMFEPPVGFFLVARSEERPRPVGGVGVRSVGPPGTGEVKRLWVDPAGRGVGLGRRLMGDLEDATRDMDLNVLQLGTGDRQPEAVALYESAGVGAFPRRPRRTAAPPLPHPLRQSPRLIGVLLHDDLRNWRPGWRSPYVVASPS